MQEKSNIYTQFVLHLATIQPFLKVILLLLFMLITLTIVAQKNLNNLPPKFQNLSLNDGLSNLATHSIYQDDLGYIWIGTARGLNRYDGISFKHYFYNDDDVSLFHDNIVELHKTPNGNIICETSTGTNIFNIEKEKILKVQSAFKGFDSFANYDSLVYCARRQGGLFQFNEEQIRLTRIDDVPANLKLDKLISVEHSGIWGKSFNNQFIINYNPATSSYAKYRLPNTDTLTVGGSIVKIKNHLIISTNSNISIFNIQRNTFENISENFSGLSAIQDKTINFIEEVEDNILWIGTKTNGLYVYNLQDQTLINYQKTDDTNTLNSNYLTCFFKDITDNIWLGTFDRGVEVAFERRKNFNFDLSLHNFTKDKFVTSICTDYNGNYYIGTRLKGLHIYNAQTKKTTILNQKNSFIEDNHIRNLLLSTTNELWISSERKLQILNLKNGKSKNVEIPRPNNGLVSFCELDGKIFAGSDKQGLLVFSLDGKLQNTIIKFGSNITQVLKQKDKNLIVASYGRGIFKYDFDKDKSQNINEIITPPLNNIDEVVTCYFDSEENLWVGNFKYGLYRIASNWNALSIFNMKSGLPSNDITGIIEDNFGNVWISTAYGLSMLNNEGKFTNYSYNEGLDNIQFHQKATLKDEFGTLFFGGNFGLTFFNPGVLDIEKTQAPQILLETLKVSNHEVKPADDTKILDKNLALTSGIVLNHHYPNFSIEFKGFDYVAAKNLKYAYVLEGSNDDWNYVDNRTFASYQNLKPGDYIFKVKAQNNNGTWSKEPAVLQIKIKPAPWFTIWAFLAYFITAVVLTLITFRLVLRAKLYKKELEIEHNERVRENEVSQMKMRFFTNISHEIRTPVTLIKGNVDYLISELNEKKLKLKSTDGLKNSTERLLKLINQLLSFRQLENDALDLKIRNEDILAITNEVVDSFRFAAKLKQVSINVRAKEQKLLVPVDKDKYEKILNNLLSNSLKFSKKKGYIKITIEKQLAEQLKDTFKVKPEIENFVKVSVIDNGKGISASVLPYIFDRFVQYNSQKAKPDYSSSGIGLNFTKRLIDLHSGSIIAKSEMKVETCFSFILPADERIYSLETLQKDDETNIKGTLVSMEPETPDTNEPQKVILIAEDDIELNKFMLNAFSDKYKVISTYDGKEALKLAKNQLPDIIVSDIMMPEMDGITLCKTIREDELISHIPIVLLTAKTEVENKITGFTCGADDYITKPFELSILKTRIQNLIKQRSILQQYYKQAIPIEFKAETVNQFEIRFMKKINNIVSENYNSHEFNVQHLAENMNMSRTSFYRKFMNITDTSPKDYITNFRINKSIELIQSGCESFGEISYLCGFSSQSIFSLAFKKVKEVTPLQFKRSMINKSI